MHQSKKKKRFIKIAQQISKESNRTHHILSRYGYRSVVNNMRPKAGEVDFLLCQLKQLREINKRLEAVFTAVLAPYRDPREITESNQPF